MYQLTTLPNGLRIVSAEMPAVHSVAIAFFIAAGSRSEPDDVQGVSHFIEHMLFKGTTHRPTSKEISEAIEGIGGILNAETGKEVTIYWDKVTRAHWRHAFEVLCDLLRNSLFDPAEIEKERRVIIEELNMLVDSPGDWVHILSDQALWGEQALGRDVGGTKESVSAISRDAMLRYMAQHYVPSNTIVSVAGAVSHDEIVAYASELLGDWAPGEPTTWPPAIDLGPHSRICLRSKRTEQAHFCIVVPALSYLHPERFALDLLNVILGEGMSSRLFLELREHHGFAYDAHSYVNHYRDTGSLVIYAGVDPKRITDAVQVTLEVAMSVTERVPEDELERAKEFFKGRTLLRLEDTRSIAGWLGGQLLMLGEIMSVDEVIANIDRVTVDDVRRLAHRLFVEQPLHASVIGPYTSEDRFLRLLRQPRRPVVSAPHSVAVASGSMRQSGS